MKHFLFLIGALFVSASQSAFAQYGTPETLKAELREGDDLSFATEAQELGTVSNLANNIFTPTRRDGDKLPALVVFHTCSLS